MIERVSRWYAMCLAVVLLLIGCAPPPELTSEQEMMVRRCLTLAYTQETSVECDQVTKPMQKSFLAKHPDFYEQLLAERKKLVEDRLAEDMRQRDQLNACLDAREAGDAKPSSCEKFMPHEISRGLEDRRRTRCANSQLDHQADARERCAGLSAAEVEEEVAMERSRRERRR